MSVPANVAVLVLNWNGRRHLEDCLRALAAQTWKAFDVVLVDNGSTDDSLAWLERQRIIPLRLIATGRNLGFAGGNAVGLNRLSPEVEHVVLLNNDTAPEPGWLAALIEAARADPRRGVVASLLVDWTAAFIDSAGIGLRVTGRGYQRFRGYPGATKVASGLVFGASAGAALYRRTMLNEIGFLDERFFMNGEDTDLSFRARLAGWEVWLASDAVVRHRVSGSQGVGSPSSVYFNERNWIWSVTKCMPAALFWKYAWMQFLELPARAWYFFRRGCFGAWLRGVSAGLLGAWQYRTERARIRLQRRITNRELERFLKYPTQMGGRDDPPAVA